jgi:hypothetical protein
MLSGSVRNVALGICRQPSMWQHVDLNHLQHWLVDSLPSLACSKVLVCIFVTNLFCILNSFRVFLGLAQLTCGTNRVAQPLLHAPSLQWGMWGQPNFSVRWWAQGGPKKWEACKVRCKHDCDNCCYRIHVCFLSYIYYVFYWPIFLRMDIPPPSHSRARRRWINFDVLAVILARCQPPLLTPQL